MKKIFAVLILAITACFALVGCAGSSGQIPSNENGNDAVITPELSESEEPNYPQQDEQPEQEEITIMYLYINENKLEVTLAENSAVDALVEILKNGDITYTANDYGGFEKVGSLGHTLPASDSQITTEAGDVMLYSGNQLVLFYGSNLWSYTRLGKINGYSVSELKTLFCAGSGSVQVRISLK